MYLCLLPGNFIPLNRSDISFPQYRRYLNGKNYFRIDSLESFEEIRSLGSKWSVETHRAKILPDHYLINDLLFHFAPFAVEISAEDYNSMRNLVFSDNR
jgi:hypothetical protein